MSDIFLRHRLFSPTEHARTDTWSMSVDVPEGSHLDEVLLAALQTSDLHGTYQAEGIGGPIGVDRPLRISFDLVVEDADGDDLADLVRIELLTFLDSSAAKVVSTSLCRPTLSPYPA